MSKPAKRKTPTLTTIKKLFLLSSNKCAFLSCNQLLYDEESDQLVGEICHIEAAEEGGERFNPKQTDEQRRHISNLILFCANHHKVTNNVEIYSVDKLKKIKKEHEQKNKNKTILNNQFLLNISSRLRVKYINNYYINYGDKQTALIIDSQHVLINQTIIKQDEKIKNTTDTSPITSKLKILSREKLKKRLELKKAFQKHIQEVRYSGVTIRDIDRMDAYPNIDRKNKGISPWFIAFIRDVYDKGLEVYVGHLYYYVIKDEKTNKWRAAKDKEKQNAICARVVGRIPFDWIVDVDWDGDEQMPHIYCEFNNRKGEPYETIPLYYYENKIEYEVEGFRPWD